MSKLDDNQITVKGAIFSFVRRRYGRKTFTWLWYKNEDDQWTEYKGDPWPSIKIPTKDLLKVRSELLEQFPLPEDLTQGIENKAEYSPEGSIQ